MQNQPVESPTSMGEGRFSKGASLEKQELKTATLLKKGKYGFYKQIDKIHSVYGDEPTIKKEKTTEGINTPQPVAFSAFEPATETNHFLHPEKIQEILQGILPKSLSPFWSINNSEPQKVAVKEGFGELEETTQSLNNQINGSTQSIQNEGSLLYKQLSENWTQIEDDVNIIGDPNARQSDKLKGFVHLIRDFIVMFYTLISVFNVNAHPNIIDIAGETLTKMFVDTDTGGLVNPEQSKLAIYYFTMIAYASVFIFIAYIATENWYYFLFYEFSEDIMTDVINKDGTTEKKEWSLQVWWSYYERERPNLFGLFHALFYVVTAMDSMFRKFRKWSKGSDNYSPIIHVVLFLCIYYWFNYWVNMTSSPAFDIIFMIIMGFAVFRVCILSYGSFSFAPASVYYPPSLFSLVIFLIKGLVLWTIDYSLMSIGKMAVYAYIMFISFGLISFSETKRKNRGITGRFFDTVREMRDYLLLNARTISEKPGADIPNTYAHFVEGSWLSISVFLVFVFMFMSLFPKTDNIQLFAPLYYFILIFWGITIVKMIINYWRSSKGYGEIIPVNNPPAGSNVSTGNNTGDYLKFLQDRKEKISQTLSQGAYMPKDINGEPTFGPENNMAETLYKTGFGMIPKIGYDTGVNTKNTILNAPSTIKELGKTIVKSVI